MIEQGSKYLSVGSKMEKNPKLRVLAYQSFDHIIIVMKLLKLFNRNFNDNHFSDYTRFYMSGGI